MASSTQQVRRREHTRECSAVLHQLLDQFRFIEVPHRLRRSGFGDGQTDTQDGVGAQLGLVRCAIEFNQEVVDQFLFLDINVFLDQGRSDDLVHVGDGFEDTLAAPVCLVSISKLTGFMLSCRGPRDERRCITSCAGVLPVLAPEGTIARCNPLPSMTSTSTWCRSAEELTGGMGAEAVLSGCPSNRRRNGRVLW